MSMGVSYDQSSGVMMKLNSLCYSLNSKINDFWTFYNGEKYVTIVQLWGGKKKRKRRKKRKRKTHTEAYISPGKMKWPQIIWPETKAVPPKLQEASISSGLVNLFKTKSILKTPLHPPRLPLWISSWLVSQPLGCRSSKGSNIPE